MDKLLSNDDRQLPVCCEPQLSPAAYGFAEKILLADQAGIKAETV